MTYPHEALAEVLAAHRLVDYGECSCGWAPASYRLGDDRSHFHRLHLASVLADHFTEAVTEARADEFRAEGLRVAAVSLRRIADYWAGRPLTHHGDHIHADLMDVLRAIEADADSLAPEAPSIRRGDPSCDHDFEPRSTMGDPYESCDKCGAMRDVASEVQR